LLGGALFSEGTQSIYDEVPARHTARAVLGLDVVVSGTRPEFSLEFWSNWYPRLVTHEVVEMDVWDLSAEIAELIGLIEGFRECRPCV